MKIEYNKPTSIVENRYKKLQAFLYREIFASVKYSEPQVKRAVKRIEIELLRVNAFCYAWAKKYIPGVYYKQLKHSEKILSRYGETKSKKINHAKEIDKLIDNYINRVIYVNKTILQNTKKFFKIKKKAFKDVEIKLQQYSYDKYQSGIDGIITRALKPQKVTGLKYKVVKSVPEVQREVFNYLEDYFGEVSFIQIVGKDGIARNYNIWKYSKMLARTELAKSQWNSTANSCQEFDTDLYQVSTHAGSCRICLDYEGVIYSISGKHPTYDQIDVDFPIHPNCAHNIDPVSETQIKLGFVTSREVA